MTAASIATARAQLPGWATAGAILAALAIIVGLRSWATRAGVDPLAVGMLFGVALAGASIVGRDRGSRPVARRTAAHLAGGVIFGGALAVMVVAGTALAGATTVPGLGRP